MKEKAYCKALDLSTYIAQKYKKDYGHDISKIKLQKSLYFLFAYWGGFVNRSKNINVDVEDDQVKNLPMYLFDDVIEAWTYGPVVREVYTNFDNYYKTANFQGIQKNISSIPQIKEFIDDILTDLFKMSDFKLVDIAHQDRCWKDRYNNLDDLHDQEIRKEDIISEYSK